MRRSASVVVVAALAVTLATCGSSGRDGAVAPEPSGLTGAPVTATTQPTPTDPASRAVATSRAFVESEAAKLATSTRQFTQAVIRGDVSVAKVLYPLARSHYESIEPIAESFRDLDKEIDAHAKDVSEFFFHGFHRIERQLFQAGNTTGMAAIANRLDFNVQVLRLRLPEIALNPGVLANGAVEDLNEIATSKITGEEDRYAHTDLWDVEANLVGARRAIAAVKRSSPRRRPPSRRRSIASFRLPKRRSPATARARGTCSTRRSPRNEGRAPLTAQVTRSPTR